MTIELGSNGNSGEKRKRNKTLWIGLVIVLAACAIVVIAIGGRRNEGSTSMDTVSPSKGTVQSSKDAVPSAPVVSENEAKGSPVPVASTGIPRLVDLGAGKCIPCKKMAPILEALREEYKGRFEVVFIDVWKDRSQAARYGIRVIPTQIYFDPSGKELKRHQGFASREDILSTWKSLGYTFE